MHLDAGRGVVVERMMAIGVGAKVGAERAVDDGEHIAIERGGHPGGVVVGSFEDSAVLHEIDAEKNVAAGAQPTAELTQQRRTRGRLEVPDRAAEEDRQPPGAGRCTRSRSKSPMTTWTSSRA